MTLRFRTTGLFTGVNIIILENARLKGELLNTEKDD